MNSPVITFIASHFGLPVAFGGAVAFIALFISGMGLVVDQPGYERLLHTAEQARRSEETGQ